MRISLVNLDDMVGVDWNKGGATMLAEDLRRMQDAINTTWDTSHNTDGTQKSQFLALNGVFWGTLAAQPVGLTVADDKLQFYVTDYGHHVYWDGTALVWRFAPGDMGNGFISVRASAPQEAGWVECDGTATTYLVVNVSFMTAAAFTTPNIKGNPSYLKIGAAYSGTINAAHAPGAAMSGATGTATTGTGTTGTGTTGTGTTGTGTSGVPSVKHRHGSITVDQNLTGLTQTVMNYADDTPDHAHNVPGLSVPGLSVPGLSVPGLSVPALGAGTLAATIDATGEPANVVWRAYFRR